MKELILALAVILMISSVYAQCNSTQIDINSASAEELDKLDGIGPVYAERIIEDRPFSSVEGLIDVSGIGNKTLEKIMLQGLACISTGANIPEENAKVYEKPAPEANVSNATNVSGGAEIPENRYIIPAQEGNLQYSSSIQAFKPETINLTPSKSIKSSDSGFTSDKIALYGFIAFSILIGAISFARFAGSKKYKSEFDKHERRDAEDKRSDDI